MEHVKTCSNCKQQLKLEMFGKLASTKDGLRYDCKLCRKAYRAANKDIIKVKNQNYYKENKTQLNISNRARWNKNKDIYNAQRFEYRNREEVKLHIQQKNKEYLPKKKENIKIKRKCDLDFQISEILRSKVHKMLSGKNTSYKEYIGCDIVFLKKWIEYKFDPDMNWNNMGSHWHIDHILPINMFDFSQEASKYLCFHWTNLQPLSPRENRAKSDKLMLHYYFNNIVSVIRFNNKYKQFLGYQNIRDSLCWLREKLRYGNKSQVKQDNPQPTHQKIKIKMKRFND